MENKKKARNNSKLSISSPRVDVKVEVKSIHLSPSSNTQGRPSVGAYASSASMVAPDPSKLPHPCFYDDFDDGELDH